LVACKNCTSNESRSTYETPVLFSHWAESPPLEGSEADDAVLVVSGDAGVDIWQSTCCAEARRKISAPSAGLIIFVEAVGPSIHQAIIHVRYVQSQFNQSDNLARQLSDARSVYRTATVLMLCRPPCLIMRCFKGKPANDMSRGSKDRQASAQRCNAFEVGHRKRSRDL
jgi:hypothetical protein